MRSFWPFVLSFFMVQTLNAQSLQEVYFIAQKESLSWRAKRLENENNQLSGEVAMSSLLPSLSFQAAQASGVSYYGADPTQGLIAQNTPFSQTTLSLDLKIPLYAPSSVKNYEAAQISEKIAEMDYELFENNYLIELATRYFDVLKKEKALSIARQELVMRERLIQDIQLRYDVGLLALTDLREAEAALSQTRSANIAATFALTQAQLALKNLLSSDINKLNDLNWEQPIKLPGRAVSQKKHFSLIKAERAVQYYQKQLESYKATLLPRLDAYSSYAQAPINQNISKSRSSITAGLSLTWAPPAGLGTIAQITQMNYTLQATQAQQTQIALEHVVQKELLAQQCYSLSQQMSAQRATVDAAMVYLDSILSGFDAGQRTTTDILEAQVFLSQQKSLLYNIGYDVLLMHLKLGLENSYNRDLLLLDIDNQLKAIDSISAIPEEGLI